jgi:hypothetical protein
MKKLRTIEIAMRDIDRDDDTMVLGSYFMARDLYNYRKGLCEEAGCENHYEMVQVKIVDSDDSEPLYGVLNTSKNRLI